MPRWRLGARSIDLSRPAIMAILNLTPDSFSDGGRLATIDAAVESAAAAVAAGAHILDIGGESTRPGAQRIPADEQTRRTEPVIRAIRRAGGALADIPISIDTTLAPVAEAAFRAGADAINDVSAGLEDPDILALAARQRLGLVLMHRLRPPGEDRYSDRYAEPPRYHDVVADVRDFLAARAHAALAAGVARESIVIDPGLGFGKTVGQNLQLVRRTAELCTLGYPVLSGASRKSFTARAAGRDETDPRDRVAESVAISLLHYEAGASIFRVHDVAEQARALAAAAAVRDSGPG